jgi:WD repeat-containing protein 1 (actin-interacting protein 1)
MLAYLFQTIYDCRLFTGHLVKTSAVAFSPSNVFAASGDTEGNLKIWFVDDLTVKKEFNSFLGGQINGIAWSEDSTKLLVYGVGKQLARAVNWDAGNNLGEISGHSSKILSGDFRQCRPYKVVTSGEDYQVGLYEGPPFKLKKMNSKVHTNFATGVKFSPNGEVYVSVGYDKKVVSYDFKEGAATILADDKTENNHKGAISGLSWINNNEFVTCSLDKSVKIWDLTNKTVTK